MSPCEQLNGVEIRITMLVWEGRTNPEIASSLGTSEQIVKNHLRGIFDKLGVWSRLELALYVSAHGGQRWADHLQAQAAAARTTVVSEQLPAY